VIEGAGGRVDHRTEREQLLPVEQWLAQAFTPDDVADALRAEIRDELAGGAPTGLRPLERDGLLLFTQTWEITVARI
jgi:hypothetical protein